MKRIPRISALMTAFPWHLSADTPVREARLFMQEHRIRHLPVTDEQHQLVGVVTLDDLPVAGDQCLSECVTPAVVVDALARADQVLTDMAEQHLPLVVLTHRDRLAGIFTRADACRQFAAWLREPFLPPDGDDDVA